MAAVASTTAAMDSDGGGTTTTTIKKTGNIQQKSAFFLDQIKQKDEDNIVIESLPVLQRPIWEIQNDIMDDNVDVLKSKINKKSKPKSPNGKDCDEGIFRKKNTNSRNGYYCSDDDDTTNKNLPNYYTKNCLNSAKYYPNRICDCTGIDTTSGKYSYKGVFTCTDVIPVGLCNEYKYKDDVNDGNNKERECEERIAYGTKTTTYEFQYDKDNDYDDHPTTLKILQTIRTVIGMDSVERSFIMPYMNGNKTYTGVSIDGCICAFTADTFCTNKSSADTTTKNVPISLSSLTCPGLSTIDVCSKFDDNAPLQDTLLIDPSCNHINSKKKNKRGLSIQEANMKKQSGKKIDSLYTPFKRFLHSTQRNDQTYDPTYSPYSFTCYSTSVPTYGNIYRPYNDECFNIQQKYLPFYAFGSTCYSSPDNLPRCADYSSVNFSGVWFLVQGTGDFITATTCSPFTNFDTYIEILTGSSFCNLDTCVAYNDDADTYYDYCFDSLQSKVTWPSQTGVLYYIFLRGFSNDQGYFDLLVNSGQSLPSAPTSPSAPFSPVAPSGPTIPPVPAPTGPINDDCKRAVVITGSTTTAISGSTATANQSRDQLTIPSCAETLTASGVWFTIIGTGQQIRADTCGDGTNFDTVIDIFSSTTPENGCDGLDTCVAENDNSNACSNNSRSSVSWMSTTGTKYYIFVHGFEGNGDFELAIDAPTSAPNTPPMPSPITQPMPMPSPITQPMPMPSPNAPPMPSPPVGISPVIGPITVPTSGGGGGGGGICFSRTNLVDVQGKGIITMDQLQIGDYVKATVLSKHEIYSRVISFSHKDDDMEAEYIQILTARCGAVESSDDEATAHSDATKQPLEISHDHMVKIFDGRLIRAADIRIGDRLFGDELIVTKVDIVKRYGLYAPVTDFGTILVSGVTASCYVALLNDFPALIQHYIAHALYAPIRMVHALNKITGFAAITVEGYTNDGLTKNYAMTAVKLVLRFEQTNPKLLQLFLVIVAAPLAVTLLALEQILTAVPLLSSSSVFVALLLVISGRCYLSKKFRKVDNIREPKEKVE